MARDIDGPNISGFTAAASYASNQYHLGAFNSTAGQIVLGSALGQRVEGVIVNDPASGEALTLRGDAGSVSKVRYGGTVAKGDKLVCAASGEAVTQTRCDQYVLGIATVAGVDNDIGEIFITHEGAQKATVLAFPIVLATVAAADVVTNMIPSVAGTIVATQFVVTTAVTTGSKGATLNLEIGTTNVTGGEVVLTSANCTPLGAVVAGAAITAANTLAITSTLSVEGSAVTTFSEGAGVLYVTIA